MGYNLGESQKAERPSSVESRGAGSMAVESASERLGHGSEGEALPGIHQAWARLWLTVENLPRGKGLGAWLSSTMLA